MDVVAVGNRVREEGYAVVPDFINAAQVAELNRGMSDIFDSVTSTDNPNLGRQTVHIHNVLAKTRVTDKYITDSRLLSLIENILGPDFQISSVVAMCPRPGDEPQKLHSDDGHFPIIPRMFPLVANTLIALDDFTAENGATQIVPRSHLVKQAVDIDAATVPIEMSAGSLAVWDGGLWHKGGGNVTNKQWRRSLNLNFNLAWLKQRENQYLGVSKEVVLQLPARLQQLMGYQLTNFGLGTVDRKHPLEFLKTVPAVV